MKNAKKIVALLLCAVLLVGASVAGTLAYLTQKTKTVQNTFTVGKVSLGEDTDNDGLIDNGLDEAKVNEYGEKLNAEGNVAADGDTLAERVTGNTYKLIPGHTYVKDPTIHVAAGSEPAYLFVEISNGISEIEADGTTTIAEQMTANGWVALSTGSNIYYKSTTVTTTETQGTDVVVFDSFTIASDADVSGYANAEIDVTAYAVQADGFADAAAAWAATFGSNS